VSEDGSRQRRGRAVAMTDAEIDDFLLSERTCRVATVGEDGSPHVAPLWFIWHGGCLYLNSIVRSQRWVDLTRDARTAVIVDAGTEYHELRGVEILGRAEIVGDVPRTADPDPLLTDPERLFARKYMVADAFEPDGRHAWLRIRPDKLVSWDFRKNPALQRP
jgi:hypothetical protein